MENIEEKFNENLEAWRGHLKKTLQSSNHMDYIDCDAYRNIVAMGPQVLPLIKNEYEKDHDIGDPGVCWSYAIHEIIPEFSLPVGKKGSGSSVEKRGGFVAININKVKKDTLRWLDENMDKYLLKTQTGKKSSDI